mmetsp:Transcript_82973/g.130863  ORF Transcript_82973/g.130863 Transcript_82973/m.130863 type:complete len:214 (+) Transcript_82973:1243-1884(+)
MSTAILLGRTQTPATAPSMALRTALRSIGTSTTFAAPTKLRLISGGFGKYTWRPPKKGGLSIGGSIRTTISPFSVKLLTPTNIRATVSSTSRSVCMFRHMWNSIAPLSLCSTQRGPSIGEDSPRLTFVNFTWNIDGSDALIEGSMEFCSISSTNLPMRGHNIFIRPLSAGAMAPSRIDSSACFFALFTTCFNVSFFWLAVAGVVAVALPSVTS